MIAFAHHRRAIRSAPAPEPETLAHAARVAAAGGTGVDLPYLNAAFRFLKTSGRLAALSAWWDPRFGYLPGTGGEVTRLFSPDPAARDLLPVAGQARPTLVGAGYKGLPELQFTAAVLAVPSFPLGPDQYATGGVLRTPVMSGLQVLAGYGPDGAGYVEWGNSNGRVRHTHATGYAGTELVMPVSDGNANYAGEQLRVSSRWLANRAGGNEVLGGASGVAATQYGFSSPRGPLTASQQNKLFTLGGAVHYGTLTMAASVTISTFYVLNDEGAAVSAAFDGFIRDQFTMPA